MWLLLICLGWEGRCDIHGGISAALVTESQCRAALTVKQVVGYCITPQGEIVRPTPRGVQ